MGAGSWVRQLRAAGFAYLVHHVVWLVCVVGAARGFGTLAALACAPVLVWHMAVERRRVSPWRWTLPVAAIGVVTDSALGALGVLQFHSTPWPDWIAPPWLIAVWVVFASAVPALMGWLRGRLLVAATLGAVGGPLAYSGGAALGAASLPEPQFSILALVITWGILTPALVAGTAHLDRAPAIPAR